MKNRRKIKNRVMNLILTKKLSDQTHKEIIRFLNRDDIVSRLYFLASGLIVLFLITHIAKFLGPVYFAIVYRVSCFSSTRHMMQQCIFLEKIAAVMKISYFNNQNFKLSIMTRSSKRYESVYFDFFVNA